MILVYEICKEKVQYMRCSIQTHNNTFKKKNNDNNNTNVYGFVFCSVPLLFVTEYVRMRMSLNPRSIAGVPFDLVGSLQTTLLLRLTCIHASPPTW